MLNRRAFLAAVPAAAAAGVRLFSAETPRPFRINIPQSTVVRILRRVKEARWPDRIEGAADWRYGANWDYMKSLAEYWTTKYDWRQAEAKLNRYPQFLAKVGDYDVHFYHVRGKGPRAVPIVLTHGWPGSVLEFQDVIGPLSDPASFGGSADDAFDVVQGRDAVAVVGHEPMLSGLVALLLGSDVDIEFKKGGVVLVEDGVLRWYATPRILRGLSPR